MRAQLRLSLHSRQFSHLENRSANKKALASPVILRISIKHDRKSRFLQLHNEITYLFPVRPHPKVNISKGSTAYSFGNAIFLLGERKQENDKVEHTAMVEGQRRTSYVEFVPKWTTASWFSQQQRKPKKCLPKLCALRNADTRTW